MEIEQLIARAEAEAVDETPLARVAAASRLSIELSALGDQVVDHFVEAARRDGCSWAQIGSVLGVTRQAVQQRYGGFLRHVRRVGHGRAGMSRFGPDARLAVVEAQTAARTLGHDHVDTEHLLLGILEAGPDAVGAAVLARCGISQDVVEQEVVAVGGSGTSAARGHIPFSPAAKKVLELSLRESLALGHRHIDTAHVLLALLRERKGVAARLLDRHGVDRDRVLRIMREGVSATGD